MTQITDNLIKVTKFRIVNCYLIQEKDGFTLIDTGVAGIEKQVLSAAEAFGKPIKRIALTHAHSDHIGGLDGLQKLLPNAEIMMSAQSARFVEGDQSLEKGQAAAKIRGSFPSVSARPTQTFKDGDMIGSLRVVATPGHTPGHHSFFDERDGTLIAGDALQILGGIAVAGVVRWRFPLPGFATWHKPTAAQSAEKLVALNPKRLAVGHGAVLENPIEAMKKAIAEAKR